MTLIVKIRNRLRKGVLALRLGWLRQVWGMDIGSGTRISLSSRLDRTNPKGIHIGTDTGIGASAVILTHDFLKTQHLDTHIGSRCHIGINAIVLPGVSIGDDCIIAPGSVVMRDVPAGSLVSGNPARVIETGLKLGPWGIRNWDGRR
jgi:acetyltransferase-like isoleucine patch superfamily enzyme